MTFTKLDACCSLHYHTAKVETPYHHQLPVFACSHLKEEAAAASTCKYFWHLRHSPSHEQNIDSKGEQLGQLPSETDRGGGGDEGAGGR